jgi:uncharacterized ParB-like nuclease family protein
LLICTLKALSAEFDHISGDKEQQLFDMQHQAGERASALAMIYAALAREAEVKDDWVAWKLVAAMQQHAPDLTSMVENDMIMRGSAPLADLVRLAKNYSKYYAMNGSHKKKRTHEIEIEELIADLRVMVTQLRTLVGFSNLMSCTCRWTTRRTSTRGWAMMDISSEMVRSLPRVWTLTLSKFNMLWSKI